MKQSEIRELSTAELQEKLGIVKKQYADLKFAHAIDVESIDNPLQLRYTRRTVARLKTELTKRELQ